MKKNIPLLLAIGSFIIAIISVAFIFVINDDLNSANAQINELMLQKDETMLTDQIAALSEDNQNLRDELLTLQLSIENTDLQTDAINAALKKILSYLVDRDCSSQDISSVSKAAYDNIRDYCTSSGFDDLISPSAYAALDKLPNDNGYVTHINQYANNYHIFTQILSDKSADVFCFYKYNNIPKGSTLPVTTDAVFYCNMIYDSQKNVWLLDKVKLQEFLQPKFDWD